MKLMKQKERMDKRKTEEERKKQKGREDFAH